MSDTWYEKVEASTRLTQGDIILNCPLVTWAEERLELSDAGDLNLDNLKAATRGIASDVIVMTQACDLEQNKVSKVVLCPCFSLSTFRGIWETVRRQQGQPVTEDRWKSHCANMRDGRVWNLSLLNSGTVEGLTTEVRVVDFHELFTVPRVFLEAFAQQRQEARLRLLPPYREHLSQSFARFFMRVGLPVPITFPW